MNKKTRLALTSIILVITIGFVAFQLLNTFGDVYVSVDAVTAEPDVYMGRTLQVKGFLQPGSLSVTSENVTLVIAGNTTTLLVILIGELPDMIDGQEIVAVGSLESATILRATNILVQCPSKYEATTTTP
ncbi:cytochrome c maturation protein CcmE [Candidatus Thorarchaeota archaeon]|nr:MAG: cytochrome c maturation protein CcmE [Candidatus Thorarchaeota archaeon]